MPNLDDAQATGSNATTVERTSDCDLVVTRWFDAPAHLVFKAWSDPALFTRWWVPRSLGVALVGCDMDVRTGGAYRLDFGGGQVFFGRYIEVVSPEKIVWTNDEDGEDASVTTVTFSESDGRTLLVMTETYPSKAALDAAGLGAAEATHETFAQLDEVLAQLG